MSNNTTFTYAPCQPGNGTSVTDDGDNSTSGLPPCGPEGGWRGRASNRAPATRTFYMQPFFEDPDGLYLKYDPMIGIRTATILGSCLMILMVYILYKAKCRSNQWTSTDQLYLENYKRRMAARSERKKNNYTRLAKDGCSRPDPAAMQATANWIQTQPLQATVQPNRTGQPHVAMCNICVQGLSQPRGRECQSNVPAMAADDSQGDHRLGGADHCFHSSPVAHNLSNHNQVPTPQCEDKLKWQKEQTGRNKRKKSNNIPMEYLNLQLDSIGNSAVAPAQSDPVPYIITRSPSYDDRLIDPDKKAPLHICAYCDRGLVCTNHNQNPLENHFFRHIPSIHHSRSAQSSLTELQMAAELDHSLHNNIMALKNVDKKSNDDEINNSLNTFASSLNPISLDDATRLTQLSPLLVSPAGNLSSPTVATVTRPNSIHIPLNSCTSKSEPTSKCDSSVSVIEASESPSNTSLPQLDIVIGADSDQSDQMTDLSVSKDSAGDTISLSDPTQSIYELSGDLDFIDATPPNEEDELEDLEMGFKAV